MKQIFTWQIKQYLSGNERVLINFSSIKMQGKRKLCVCQWRFLILWDFPPPPPTQWTVNYFDELYDSWKLLKMNECVFTLFAIFFLSESNWNSIKHWGTQYSERYVKIFLGNVNLSHCSTHRSEVSLGNFFLRSTEMSNTLFSHLWKLLQFKWNSLIDAKYK